MWGGIVFAGREAFRNRAPAIGGLDLGRLAPYLWGGLLIVLGTILRVLLDPLLGDRVVFLFLVPGVLVASTRGGLWPGLGATAFGIVLGSAVLMRYGAILGNQLDAVFFGALGVAVAVGGERLARMQRRNAEMTEALLEREAHVTSILETVPDAMVVIDDRGIVQSFSTAAERLFGYSASEVVGGNVSVLMPEPDRSNHDAYLQRYRETAERRMIDHGRVVTGLRRDGSLFPIELAVGEVRSKDRVFFTGFITDLTEARRDQARVQELQAELVHIARLSAMGEMASTLAHELNQPLAAIANYLKGSARLLERAEFDNAPKVRGAIEKAAEQALRGGQIIRRLRDFVSRGDTEKSLVPVSSLIDDASSLGLVGAHEHGIVTRLDLKARNASVLVDPVQIQQVLLNLIRNAIEAMQASERRELTISTSYGPAAAQVEIAVADTGPGISDEVARRLFEPFMSTKEGGMGIGLSISRTIVEAHGGRLWAERNETGGATFRMTIPAADQA